MLANHYGGRLVREQPDDNPFLDNFYQNRKRYAFQVQLFFLLSRFKQQQEFISGDLLDSHIICDYFFGKDRIFATLNLTSDELTLYDHVASLYEKNIPLPDQIIYLTASLDVLLDRIKKRNRKNEKYIDKEYINNVCEHYSRYFFHFSQTPLLVINTDNANFQAQPDQFEYLVQKLKHLKPGTSYLVPTA